METKPKKHKKWVKAVICNVCGKETSGRLPRSGNHKGTGDFWFPRRHKVNGKDCPGNIEEGEIIGWSKDDINT